MPVSPFLEYTTPNATRSSTKAGLFRKRLLVSMLWEMGWKLSPQSGFYITRSLPSPGSGGGESCDGSREATRP
jgi:hypothetical protein